jgi:hypothetical protein
MPSASDWSDDPDVQRKAHEHAVRMGIVRSAVIWTPLFLVSAGAFVFFLVDEATGGDRGSWFLVVVLAIFGLLFGVQSIQSLLDLASEPAILEGQVGRRWSRRDSFVAKSHYMRVGRQILRGDQFTLGGISTGDRVRVRFHRRSSVVIEAEKLSEPGQPTAVEQPAAEPRRGRKSRGPAPGIRWDE